MKNLNRLMLACALASCSPFVIPVIRTPAASAAPSFSEWIRIDRLGASVLRVFPPRQGAMIFQLDPGSPLAGIAARGDTITAVDGVRFRTIDDLADIIEHLPASSRVTFRIAVGDPHVVGGAPISEHEASPVLVP